jgi:hypothetical protein
MTNIYPLAPAVWLVGWLIMRAGGSKGPHAGWVVAHSVWILGFALFAVAAFGLYRMVARYRPAGIVGLALSFAGAAALIAQMGVDIAAAVGADTREEMSAASDRLTSAPGVELLLYEVGPPLLFTGLLVLLGRVSAAGAAPWSATALTAVGIVLMVVGRPMDGWPRALEGIGTVLVGAGMYLATVRPPTAYPGLRSR